ncbi:uncharacterized protein LOC113853016 [Abrus precatorius]|uniref:Uncharacterized protein LOC113853016 n=1 Tax=Abrus precatorius TaxID=3816 RepID=A0A8B8K7M4_ABRPR|nr:uncharacterized protein LOC113853016 [Abrus precatorius]
MRDTNTMTMTMTATTDQWMQFYQQPLMDALPPNREGFSDATVMTTSPTPTMPSESNNILSPTSGQLTPKGSVSKPIRRRSRASKRTPTTLLNANTTNFRALVQQFTGCPSTTMSTLGVHKGPITLNFQQGSGQKIQHSASRIILPFRSTKSYNNNQVHQVPSHLPWQKQEEQVPQQQLLQEHHNGYSIDYVKNSGFLPSSGNSIRPTTTMVVSDGLLMDNDFGLHDLTVNSFPNDTF